MNGLSRLTRGTLLLATLATSSRGADSGAEPSDSIFGSGLLVQLQVSDLERSLRFYTETLAFRLTERRDDLQFAHVDCGVPGLQLGLAGGGALPPQPGSVALNFSVKGDLERTRGMLEARGVVFTGPTRVIKGKVRLAEFLDPDGYRIRLAGPDPAEK